MYKLRQVETCRLIESLDIVLQIYLVNVRKYKCQYILCQMRIINIPEYRFNNRKADKTFIKFFELLFFGSYYKNDISFDCEVHLEYIIQ